MTSLMTPCPSTPMSPPSLKLRFSSLTHLKNLPLPNSFCHQILVHSLISSRLDYCYNVLASLPDINIQKLQSVQTAALCLRTKLITSPPLDSYTGSPSVIISAVKRWSWSINPSMIRHLTTSSPFSCPIPLAYSFSLVVS